MRAKTIRLFIGAAALLALGCVGDNPEYCADDAACKDTTREGYDSTKPYCHGVGNFCHSGCNTDADCNTKTSKNEGWYDPARPYCDWATHDCVAKTSDAAPLDAGDGPRPDMADAMVADGAVNGTACTGDTRCATGLCVDGYCCDTACGGTCEACNVTGKLGTCSPVPAGKDPADECKGKAPCGAEFCDGARACQKAAPATTACGGSCSSGSTLAQLLCDGAGKCGTSPKSVKCDPSLCDASAKPFAACAKGCKDNTGCVTGSACDRADAHKTGLGVCVKTADVLSVTGALSLDNAIQDLNKGTLSQGHILIPSGTFSADLNITSSKKIKIIGNGKGKTSITPTSSNSKAPVIVNAGANVTLQGVTVSGSKAGGIKCEGTSSKPGTLVLLESEVSGNAGLGVSGTFCDVELRRNTVKGNKGGGVELTKGNFVLINNIASLNGVLGGTNTVGGVALNQGPGASISFLNNTVVDNLALGTNASGISCQGIAGTFSNSIVWNKANKPSDAITSSCKFSDSDVQGYTGGTNNISKDPLLDTSYKPKTSPQSPCIDAGKTTTETIIDILGNPRPAVSGGKVDMGAFEVK